MTTDARRVAIAAAAGSLLLMLLWLGYGILGPGVSALSAAAVLGVLFLASIVVFVILVIIAVDEHRLAWGGSRLASRRAGVGYHRRDGGLQRPDTHSQIRCVSPCDRAALTSRWEFSRADGLHAR